MIPDLYAPVDEVAPRLLGAVLRHGPVAVRLTEVEAYDGRDGSGVARLPRPDRAECGHVRAARAPVHLLHVRHALGGQHRLRSGRSRLGGAAAGRRGDRRHRGGAIRRGDVRDRDLARGPGRLTQALGLHAEHKGCDLFGDGPVTLAPPAELAAMIMAGPRVGVSVEARSAVAVLGRR